MLPGAWRETAAGLVVGLGLALYVGPLTHVAGHRDDHVHVGGSVVPVSTHAHDGERRHAHPHPPSHRHDAPAPAPDGAPSAPPADPSHGDGSFAHFAAFLAPAQAAIAVVPVWTGVLTAPAPVARAATPPAVRLAAPRGPPTPA